MQNNYFIFFALSILKYQFPRFIEINNNIIILIRYSYN